MSDHKHCQRCGAEVPPDAPQGVCPQCLMQAGMRQDRTLGQMRIRCPHCKNAVEVIHDTPLQDVSCPSCGSGFNLVTGETVTYRPTGTKTLGHFQLLEELGMGAFGSVWKAKDQELDRTVAVKIPRKGQLNSAETEQFIREARAAAQLRHPHIVAVHEVGREDDTVYIVSDFVEGLTLADWMTGQRMGFREIAQFCAQVADALQHAHDAGVVHRDLKPSNIMISSVSASEADAATSELAPHIMDFGLAKREAGEITMTVEGRILGTPAYMSPEQARGEGYRADGRADIYSLGVILFELLTGERPFRGNSRMLLHQVLNEDAPGPRKFESAIPRDLETICLKCLQKDPGKRYATGRELAEELRRYLRGEAILARPISKLERFGRWCRRNPVVAGLSAVAILLLIGICIVTTLAAIKQSRLRKTADDERDKAKVSAAAEKEARRDEQRQKELAQANEQQALNNLYVAHMNLAFQAFAVEDLPQVIDYLSRYLPQDGKKDLRGFEWYYLWKKCRIHYQEFEHTRMLTGAMYFPDGKSIVTSGADARVYVWDAATGKRKASLKGFRYPIIHMALSPDGKYVAAGGTRADKAVFVWDVETGDRIKSLEFPAGKVTRVAFLPNGKSLAAVGGANKNAASNSVGSLMIWNLETGEVKANYQGQHYALETLTVSRDGKTVVVDPGGVLRLWDAESGKFRDALQEKVKQEINSIITTAEFSPSEDLLAAESRDAENPGILLWDIKTQKTVGQIPHDADIHQLRFSRDGSLLAASDNDGMVHVWQMSDQKLIGSFEARITRLNPLDFSPDGQLLAAGGFNRWLKVWELNRNAQPEVYSGHPGVVHSTAITPDGRTIVGAGKNMVSIWDRHTGKVIRTIKNFPKVIWKMKLSPDGKTIAVATDHQTESITLWNVADGKKISTITGHKGYTPDLAFSPDGKRLATGSGFKVVEIWDVQTGDRLASLQGHTSRVVAVAFSPSGKLIASGSWDGTVRLWDVTENKELKVLRGHGDQINSVTFSPDGAALASASNDKTVRLWDVARGRLKATLVGHASWVKDVAFSPDGQSLASCGDEVRLWNLTTGEAVAKLEDHEGGVTDVVFLPDSKTLLSSGGDGTVRFWYTATEDQVQGWLRRNSGK